VTFVMEQHLGHRTYYLNLRRRLVALPAQIQAAWAEVHYAPQGELWERVPGLPAYVRGTLRGRAEVRRALGGAPADVLFFNTQVPALLGGALTRRRPYLVATDLTPAQYDRLGAQYSHRADRGGPLAAYKHAANRRALRGAAHLLPWSHWAARSLVADYGVAPERVSVLPPGVDLACWRPRPRSENGPPRILFVGGDFARKGGDLLLDAYAALPAGAAELTLVTRSPLAAPPGVLVRSDLRPNDPELVELFQRHDIFALPSAGEAFGIAAVEASACGLPVLATTVGGLPDIVADGESGFLVPPCDGGALAERLRLLVEDAGLRARMGRAARARAMSSFDAGRNAERLVGYIRRYGTGQQEVRDAA
jgi:glycosyltransferase involved in cell wall biosynthesis